MANEERIDSIADLGAIGKEVDQITEWLKQLGISIKGAGNAEGLRGAADSLRQVRTESQNTAEAAARMAQNVNGVNAAMNNAVEAARQIVSGSQQITSAWRDQANTLQQNIRLQVQFKMEMDALKTSQKGYEEALKAGTFTATTYADKTAQITEKTGALKVSISELQHAINAQQKELQATDGSMDQMTQRLGQMRDMYRQLSAEERNSPFGQILQKDIQALDTELKGLNFSTGNFQSNVGNYASAFGGPFKVLQQELTEVREQLAGMNQGDAGYGKIAQEAQQLELVLGGLNKEFSSSRQEFRAYSEAAKQLGTQLGLDSEVYQQFAKGVGQADNNLQRIQKTIKLQASDMPILEGVVQAAHGLAGGYGAALAAAQLFGNDNENLQKNMMKMFAVMQLINGTQAVFNTLQRESAAMQLILTIREKAVAAAMVLKNFALTGSIGLTKARTVVEVENTEAQAINTEATIANAEAQEVEAAATVEVTTATEAASGAMIGLRAALLATGIGAILVLLGYAASAMTKFGNSAKDVTKDSKDLADAQSKLNEIFIAQADLLEKTDQTSKKLADAMLARSEASGEDAYKQFALKKSLADAEKGIADGQIANLNVTAKGQGDLLTKIQDATTKQGQAMGLYMKALNDGDERKAKVTKELADGYEQQARDAQAMYDAGDSALKASADADLKSQTLILEQSKFSAEEQRTLALQTAKIKSDAVIEANERILNDDESTKEQRIAAQKNILIAQLAAISAERKAHESAPGVTKAQRAGFDKDANAAAMQATERYRSALSKLNEDYNNRDILARAEAVKGSIETDAKAQEIIYNDERNSLEKRLAAYEKYVQDQKALTEGEKNTALLKPGLTDDETRTINTTYNNKVNDIDTKATQERPKIALNSVDNDAKKQGLEIDTTGIYAEIAAMDALNKKYEDGAISLKKYNSEKDKIENSAALNGLKQQEKVLEQLRASYIALGKDTTEVDNQIAKNEQAQSNIAKKNIKDQEQGREELKNQTIALAQETTSFIFSLLDDEVEREKNAIQKQINQVDISKEQELKALQATTMGAQEKAAQIAIINQKAESEKEALQMKARKLDQEKARYDKAASVAAAIEGTAVGIAKSLSYGGWVGIALAAVVGALGAVQIAKIAATPIPTYYTGTDSARGGWALTDERGPEMYIEPSGKTYLGNDSPTLRNLVAGTKIIPAHKVNDMLNADMMINLRRGRDAEGGSYDKEIVQQLKTLISSTNATRSAISKMKAPTVIVTSRARWHEYITKNTQ